MVWTHAVDLLPGTPVQADRHGLPVWGTQHEPYYDKDLFVPEDWMMNYPGSRCVRLRMRMRVWRERLSGLCCLACCIHVSQMDSRT